MLIQSFLGVSGPTVRFTKNIQPIFNIPKGQRIVKETLPCLTIFCPELCPLVIRNTKAACGLFFFSG